MAAVPVGVGVGDEVVLLLRAQTPFVLRRREGGEEDTVEYDLVGDYYIFDEEVMSGEVLNALDGSSVVEFGIVERNVLRVWHG